VKEFAESFEVLWRRHAMHQIGDVGRLISVHVEEQGRVGVRSGEGGKIICLLRPRVRVSAGCIVWTYPVCIAGEIIFEVLGNWEGSGVLSWLRMRALPVGVGKFDVDLPFCWFDALADIYGSGLTFSRWPTEIESIASSNRLSRLGVNPSKFRFNQPSGVAMTTPSKVCLWPSSVTTLTPPAPIRGSWVST
jgi:hypothetical protein